MTDRTRSAAHRLLSIVLAADALSMAGCTAFKVVTAPVKLAATTVVVGTETATAAVKATGRVTTSAFNAAGRVGGDSIDAAARLTETGMVTFVDASTGAIVRVPWREGYTIAAAGADARVQLARRAVDLVRAGALVWSAHHGGDAPLAAGDVVRIRG